jgi:hypothetical protein
MKRTLKILIIALVLGFAALQLLRPSFSNPPITPGNPVEETMTVPSDVQMLLSRSCNDCHSNKTQYPWYSQISPVSWFLAGHIEDGRRELNFSEWGAYSQDRRMRKLEEICEMVEDGSMPLPSYLWVHPDAALGVEERRAICEWSRSAMPGL